MLVTARDLYIHSLKVYEFLTCPMHATCLDPLILLYLIA
jgi:hypothetical protein